MTGSGEKIFDDVVTGNIEICRRCFKPSQPTKEQDSVGGGASCGDDCGTLSATLEQRPISHSVIEGRSGRLVSLIRQNGYEINEEAYSDVIELLGEGSKPPRTVFVDAIRAGIGEASIQDLLKKHSIESKQTQLTRKIIAKLPTSDISEEEFETIDDGVASEIQTVSESHRPGFSTYYLPDSAALPEKYQLTSTGYEMPKRTMHTIIEQNESWFWNTSSDNIENWLDELDPGFEECAASCLFNHIKSRHRYSAGDSPPPEEQFRSSSLWPLLKDDLEDIMGFLRRNDGSQTTQEIADYADLSENTARTILIVAENAQPVDGADRWEATDYPSSR